MKDVSSVIEEMSCIWQFAVIHTFVTLGTPCGFLSAMVQVVVEQVGVDVNLQ